MGNRFCQALSGLSQNSCHNGCSATTKAARKIGLFPKCTKLMKINFVGHNLPIERGTLKCTVLWSNLCYRITLNEMEDLSLIFPIFLVGRGDYSTQSMPQMVIMAISLCINA